MWLEPLQARRLERLPVIQPRRTLLVRLARSAGLTIRDRIIGIADRWSVDDYRRERRPKTLMDFSELSGLVLVIVGAVLFVTAVQLYTFWAGEAVLAAVSRRVEEQLASVRRSLPIPAKRRRKAA